MGFTSTHWRSGRWAWVLGGAVVCAVLVVALTAPRQGKTPKESRLSSPLSRGEREASAFPVAEGEGTGERQVAPWPTFRGDARQSGVAASHLPDRLDLLWSIEAGARVESTAAITGGRVFVGSDAGVLLCLDLSDGREKWRAKGEDAISAAPGVREGRVYVGDRAGVFHCFDAETGESLWSVKTEAEIISSANFSDGRILFGSYDNRLYCLTPEGRTAWTFETRAQVHCSPCIADGEAAIAGCEGLLRLIDIAKGEQTAQVELGSYVAAAPATDGKRFYVATYDGRMMAVDPAAGDIVWQVASEGGFPFYASPAVRGDVVVFAGRDGIVRALDAATGKERWRFRAKAKVDSSPVIVAERVFFGSNDGTLYEVALKDGVPRWTFAAGAPIVASPAVGEGRLVIGTQDGVIYCFGARGNTP